MAGPAVLRRWLEPVGNGGSQIDGRSETSVSDRTRLTGPLIIKSTELCSVLFHIILIWFWISFPTLSAICDRDRMRVKSRP